MMRCQFAGRGVALALAVFGLTAAAAAQSQGTFPGDQAPPPRAEQAPPAPAQSSLPPQAEAAPSPPPRPEAAPSERTVPAAPEGTPSPARDVAADRVASPPGFPYRLPYEKGDPVPPGYRVEERSNTGLMWGGGLMLSAAYLAAIMAGPSGNEDGSGWVLVPVIGPFAAVVEQRVVCSATVVSSATTEECSEEIISAARTATFLVVDGLVQTAGAALLLIGWGTTERQLVLDRQVAVLPEARQGAYGVSVIGSF